MKIRYSIILTAVVFIAALGIGLWCKKEYKDFNKETQPLNHFCIGIFPDEIVDMQMEMLREMLPDSKSIIAARCEGKAEYYFSCAVQPVIVEQVFRGEELKKGNQIKVPVVSNLFFEKDMYIAGKPLANIGFMNEMVPGKMYLIFLDRKINTYDEEQIYAYNRDFIIRPNFCCETTENSPCISVSKMTNSVPYETVSENEYFVKSEKTIEKLNALKQELLKKYKIE